MSRDPRIPGLRRLLRPRTPDETVERDIDDEIRFHLDRRTEDLMDEGIGADEARRRAEQEYGDVNESRRELAGVDRRYRGGERRAQWWEALVLDLRYAIRGIRRSPGFGVVVILTLALGIGANAIMFGVVDRLLLRPPPHIAAPEEVVRIYFRERQAGAAPGGVPDAQPVSTYPLVIALRENVPSLENLSAIFRTAYTMDRGRDAQEVWVGAVDGNFFTTLGTRPVLGRAFAPDEAAIPVGQRVAVLSHDFWRRHFGGAPDVLGAAVELDTESFTVIGVAPEDFNGVDLQQVDVWVPISSVAAAGFGDDWHSSPGSWWVRIVGRLAPGASATQVESEATVALRNAVREWQQPWRDSLGVVVTGPIIAARGPSETPREARVSIWLLGVAGVVLLIACANIANLFIARALRRRREIALRIALGVGRGRLIRQLIAETMLLAVIAAAVALLLTHWEADVVRSTLLPGAAWQSSLLDGRVVLFTAGAALLTGLLAGVAPALRAAGTDLGSSLRSGGLQAIGGRSRLRTGLLVLQTALSVLLLVGAGLFVRSLNNMGAVDVGMDLDRVMLVRMSLARAGFEEERIREVFRAAHERAVAIPGVDRATLITGSIPGRVGQAGRFVLPGRDSLPRLERGGPYYSAVDPEYFATLGARILRGRGISPADEFAGARVMVINQHLASGYWPDGDAIGQCLRIGNESECTEIVGIVQNVMLFNMVGDERALFYMPITHPYAARRPPGALLVRTAGGTAGVAGALRREIQAIDQGMPFVSVQSFGELVAPQLAPWRLGATMFSIFGGLALLIAAIGLYSVISYVTSQRTHEIGVRMALGAERHDVIRLVLVGALAVVGVGLALGALAAVLAGRWVEPLLYETSPRDPAIFAAVAVVLAVAATAASLMPALRASRVDPAIALRAD